MRIGKIVTAALLGALLLACGGEEDELAGLFEDENLKRCVVKRLERDADYGFEISDIVRVDCGNRNITTLAGIEHMTSLWTLHIENNPVEDYSGIEKTPLQRLYLNNMPVAPDLSKIGKITTLEELYAEDANLTTAQIDQLADATLPNLDMMDFDHNNITSIEGMRNLHDVRRIDLDYNYISDASPLYDLENLEEVYLWANCFEDPYAAEEEAVAYNDAIVIGAPPGLEPHSPEECAEAREEYGR